MQNRDDQAYFTARKRTRFFVVLVLILAVSTAAALANPQIKTNWASYAVDGATAQEVLGQMQQRGPPGSWAQTRWHVRWTVSCKVTVNIDYVMPRHVRRGAMPAHLRARWDQMVTSLKAHEQRHGAHGINAARELVQKRCRNGDAIVRKWSNQDVIYDQRTGHGRTEGVVFP